MKKLNYILVILTLFSSCRRGPLTFEPTIELNRLEVVSFDEAGKPLTMDVEITYPECPGDQIEILRGDKKFTDCILENFKKQDRAKAKILWQWNELGYYDWEVNKIGQCERKVDRDDEVSYDMIEECEDYVVYGDNVGFRCKRIATADLIKVCPWFRRK